MIVKYNGPFHSVDYMGTTFNRGVGVEVKGEALATIRKNIGCKTNFPFVIEEDNETGAAAPKPSASPVAAGKGK